MMRSYQKGKEIKNSAIEGNEMVKLLQHTHYKAVLHMNA